MRIHSIIPCSRSEGPGLRFCIWVQGCSRRCKGCFNPETWAHEGGREYSDKELLELILNTAGIEGITLLGGEPMEQAAELYPLAKAVRHAGLSVLCFTGYTIEEIRQSQDAAMLSLLEETDLLIDGAFIEAQKDLSRPWLGSLNQRYIFLSQRYSMQDIKPCQNRLEIRISPDGTLTVNGLADSRSLRELEKNLSKR